MEHSLRLSIVGSFGYVWGLSDLLALVDVLCVGLQWVVWGSVRQVPTITTHTRITRAHATLPCSLTPILCNKALNTYAPSEALHEEGLCAALAGVSSEHVDGFVREEGGGVLAHVDLLVLQLPVAVEQVNHIGAILHRHTE